MSNQALGSYVDFPTFIVSLMSGDWLFFNPGEITWDGKHHSIVGIQANAVKIDSLMDYVNSVIDDFDDVNEVVNYFVGFLNEVEKDEGLIVPRSSIAPGVARALPEGDMTGITFANLAACGSAFSIQMTEPDNYIVFFDTRLSAGIPQFFNRMARLIWDFRQLLGSLTDKPFEVSFMPTRNIDADQCLGNVDDRVNGAQNNPNTMKVSEQPAVDIGAVARLDDAGEIAESAIDEDLSDANELSSEESESLASVDLLRAFLVVQQLMGKEFPQDVLDDLDRAEAGDESVDLLALMSRINDLSGEAQAVDLSNVSFTQGLTAKGRRFSISVPDGWTVIENYKETSPFGTITRPFIAFQGSDENNQDIQLSDKVIYGVQDAGETMDDTMKEMGTYDLKWAMIYSNSYNQDNNGGIFGAKPATIWSEEIDAVNTRCFVSQVKVGAGAEFYVWPYAFDHMDYLRFPFSNIAEKDIEAARDLVKKITQSIELDNPIVSQCEKSLKKALKNKIPSKDFEEMVVSYMKAFLAVRQMVFDASVHKHSESLDNLTEEDVVIAGSKGLIELSDRAALTLDKLLDAYEVQASKGATSKQLEQYRDKLSAYYENAVSLESVFSGDIATIAEMLRVLKPTAVVKNVHKRFKETTSKAGKPKAPTNTTIEKPKTSTSATTKKSTASTSTTTKKPSASASKTTRKSTTSTNATTKTTKASTKTIADKSKAGSTSQAAQPKTGVKPHKTAALWRLEKELSEIQQNLEDVRQRAKDLLVWQKIKSELEEENKKLHSDLRSLGWFKFSEKKEIQEKIRKNKLDLEAVEGKISKAQSYKESIPGLEKKLSEVKARKLSEEKAIRAKAYSD